MLRLLERLDRKRFRPFSLIPFAGPMERELRALDVPYRVIEMRTHNMPSWKSAIQLTRLAFQIRRFGPHLIHAAETAYRAVSMASRRTSRICHYHHCLATTEDLAWLFRLAPDRLLCPSRMVRENLESCLVPLGLRPPLRVAFPPVDTQWFRPSGSRAGDRLLVGLDAAAPQVTILGALAEHKGHKCFLQAASIVLQSRPDAMFNIVGDETGRNLGYRAELESLVVELGLERAVKFWGFVSDVQARDILACSDVLVAASREEGFGMTLAEAQACEVPVVASRIRPFDEVIRDGQTGFLVQLGNAGEFAARTLELLDNDALRCRMGKAGREWACTEFGIEPYAQQMMIDYEGMLA